MALVCKVELSQTDGLTLTVLNKDGKITQTSTFNGSTIIHICKGDKETSTITQKEGEVIMHIRKEIDGYFNDEESTITQTMNSITHCVTDSVDTSTITQKPDSLVMECKSFTVDAETINCSSTKDTKHEATGAFSIDSTKTATLNSSADVNISAKTNLNLKASADLAVEATAGLKLNGATVKAAAGSTMDVEGLTTTVKGSSMATISGPLIQLG